MMGGCSCVYVDHDCEAEFWTERIIKARKAHHCCECKQDILPGDTYVREKILTEGYWDTYATCLDCVSARRAFFCDGYYYGMVWEMLEEHIKALNGEIASSCIVPLTPKARERVCDLIEQAWSEIEELSDSSYLQRKLSPLWSTDG